MKTPYAIIIMDGYGLNPKHEGNAVWTDGSKNVTALEKEYPSSTLGASGMSVGLPDGQMGNSEVGHLNIGAGRIVYQDLTKITKEIRDGEFFRNKELLRVMDYVKANGKNCTCTGLFPTAAYTATSSIYTPLWKWRKRGARTGVYPRVHRRARRSPTSGAEFLNALQNKLDELKFGKIASVSGRYYAMDRDNNWDREQKAYEALTEGKANTFCGTAEEAAKASYANGVTDEFIVPVTLTENGKPIALIGKGDGIICFNFRPDRARQITRMFSQEKFPFVDEKTGATLGFERATGYLAPVYVGFATYDASFKNVGVAFPPDEIDDTLPQYISSLGMTQLHIAETEKYAHVTFFSTRKSKRPWRAKLVS